MIDDVFHPQAPGASVSDDATFERRLRTSLSAPIHHTPGDFGLDQIWMALDSQRREQRRALRRRRVLRCLASVKRSLLGWMERAA